MFGVGDAEIILKPVGEFGEIDEFTASSMLVLNEFHLLCIFRVSGRGWRVSVL